VKTKQFNLLAQKNETMQALTLTVQQLYSPFKKSPPDNITTLSSLQKQVRSNMKGREAGIYKRTANV